MDYKQIVLYIAETKQGLRRDLIEKIGFEDYDHFRSISVLKEIFINGRPGLEKHFGSGKAEKFLPRTDGRGKTARPSVCQTGALALFMEAC